MAGLMSRISFYLRLLRSFADNYSFQDDCRAGLDQNSGHLGSPGT
jgi:hypothetical protein